jgi:perosamine synthetase
MRLLPTENWPYSLLDAWRGTLAAWDSRISRMPLALPGLGGSTPIRSARAAIIIAIQALGLRPGSRIGVPLYCCPVVFKAIRAAGCVSTFLDVDPKTFCVSPEFVAAKESSLNALVAVHMFGNMCDMPGLLRAMKGKPLIEDCAQSLGSRLGGHVSGSFGDISIFSFRFGKYLSVGEGGAIFSRNSGLSQRISELVAVLPPPTYADEGLHIVKTYLRAKLRSRQLWGSIGSRIWGIYNQRTEFVDKSPIVLAQAYRSDLATIHRRLPRLDSMIARQREIADEYERHLRIAPAILYTERHGTFLNRLMYPITFPAHEERDALSAYLRGYSISTATPYEDVITGAAGNYGYTGDCPMTEDLLRRTLIIPSHYALRGKDVDNIVHTLNVGWASLKSFKS